MTIKAPAAPINTLRIIYYFTEFLSYFMERIAAMMNVLSPNSLTKFTKKADIKGPYPSFFIYSARIYIY